MSIFAFAFVVTAVTASARYCPDCWSSSVNVNNYNDAVVANDVNADANTGHNGGGIASIETGDADSLATAYTDANHNYTQVNQVARRGRVNVNNHNSMDVVNYVGANANTGHNNGCIAGIETGDADAVAVAETEGNTNYTEVNRAAYRVNVNNGNRAMVINEVGANANTGHNSGWLVGVETGNANSTAQSITMVNSNVTKIK